MHQSSPTGSRACLFAVLFAAASIGLCVNGDEPVAPAAQSSNVHAIIVDELKPLNSLIGDWRGVGQVKRGSRQGAWSEKTSIAWDFSLESPAIVIIAEDGKQFQQLRLMWDKPTQKIRLLQKTESGTNSFSGQMPTDWPEKLVLESAEDKDGSMLRCTIQQLKDIRATVLLEKRSSAEGTFRRVSEVGYTRAGTQLAVPGGNQRKCIVTGGLGTIPVTHDGKTYYVCCQGCVQAFNDSPAAIIAEYQASLKPASEE